MAITSIKFECDRALSAQDMNGFARRGADGCRCTETDGSAYEYEVDIGNGNLTDIIEYTQLIGGAQ